MENNNYMSDDDREYNVPKQKRYSEWDNNENYDNQDPNYYDGNYD
tara:strand:+ start:99 stop:233 length:135 start_codon:yes stop_codon:yes gene_type:complete